MNKTYTGIIVEEGIIDNRIINQFKVNAVQITGHRNPSDRWHMYEVIAAEEEIFDLAKYMVDGWYAHFWNGDTVIAIFKNRYFKFMHSDRNTWADVLSYGKEIGISEEQLDFPIAGLSQSDQEMDDYYTLS